MDAILTKKAEELAKDLAYQVLLVDEPQKLGIEIVDRSSSAGECAFFGDSMSQSRLSSRISLQP